MWFALTQPSERGRKKVGPKPDRIAVATATSSPHPSIGQLMKIASLDLADLDRVKFIFP
ncbi:hypothetical protein ZHAS_00011333 [Anopheles sinensis]|uniref:Uncharacterized protein n=1 Tax=Anopheles sinensis TaxID=74873 RepID=A0A084VZY1_ANOSI|nr:hypothetical protein ZHAS_00011333 [Anopheles sinensis]